MKKWLERLVNDGLMSEELVEGWEGRPWAEDVARWMGMVRLPSGGWGRKQGRPHLDEDRGEDEADAEMGGEEEDEMDEMEGVEVEQSGVDDDMPDAMDGVVEEPEEWLVNAYLQI